MYEKNVYTKQWLHFNQQAKTPMLIDSLHWTTEGHICTLKLYSTEKSYDWIAVKMASLVQRKQEFNTKTESNQTLKVILPNKKDNLPLFSWFSSAQDPQYNCSC